MRGLTCIAPECTREQMSELDVCKTHRGQQLRGLPLTTLDRKSRKSEPCTYRNCDGKQLARFDVCQAHRRQQLRGVTLQPIRRRNMSECTFEPCDRLQTPRSDFCREHRRMQVKGQELKPIQVVKRKVLYTDDDTCLYGPCELKPTAKEYCNGHYYQYAAGQALHPLGQRKIGRSPVTNVKKGYSDTQKCGTCKQTKNWRLFVMGLENGNSKQPECKVCWKDRVNPDRVPEEKKPIDTQALLEVVFGGREEICGQQQSHQ